MLQVVGPELKQGGVGRADSTRTEKAWLRSVEDAQAARMPFTNPTISGVTQDTHLMVKECLERMRRIENAVVVLGHAVAVLNRHLVDAAEFAKGVEDAARARGEVD